MANVKIGHEIQTQLLWIGPSSTFAFENLLRIFDFLLLTPQTDPNPVRITFGVGYNAPGLQKNSLPFLSLLSQFGSLPASHNRQVEGLGGPVKSFWAHHLIDFYRFSVSKSIRLL
jgi:hypothetical protein